MICHASMASSSSSPNRSRMLVSTATSWGFCIGSVDDCEACFQKLLALLFCQLVAPLTGSLRDRVPVHLLFWFGGGGLFFHGPSFSARSRRASTLSLHRIHQRCQ